MDQFRQQQPTPYQRAQLLGDRLKSVRGMLGGDPSSFVGYLMQSDPQFAGFVRSVQGKTPQQAFAEHGLDFGQFSGLL